MRAPTPTREQVQVQELLVRVARRMRTLVGRAGPAPEVESPQVPLLKVVGAEPAEVVPAELVASYDGFNLHAATAFEAHERLGVERFCRYALKQQKADGTTQVVFSPPTLLQRLASLWPQPRIHLTRHHGLLASPELLTLRVFA